MGRDIAADAALDDETAEKLKGFLKTKLSPGDHAQVCDMLEAAGGEPDTEAQDDDLPENAVARPPASNRGSAGVATDAAFRARFPGLSHVKIDNSGIQPTRAARYSDAATASFAARFPDLARIKLA